MVATIRVATENPASPSADGAAIGCSVTRVAHPFVPPSAPERGGTLTCIVLIVDHLLPGFSPRATAENASTSCCGISGESGRKRSGSGPRRLHDDEARARAEEPVLPLLDEREERVHDGGIELAPGRALDLVDRL